MEKSWVGEIKLGGEKELGMKSWVSEKDLQSGSKRKNNF